MTPIYLRANEIMTVYTQLGPNKIIWCDTKKISFETTSPLIKKVAYLVFNVGSLRKLI